MMPLSKRRQNDVITFLSNGTLWKAYNIYLEVNIIFISFLIILSLNDSKWHVQNNIVSKLKKKFKSSNERMWIMFYYISFYCATGIPYVLLLLRMGPVVVLRFSPINITGKMNVRPILQNYFCISFLSLTYASFSIQWNFYCVFSILL